MPPIEVPPWESILSKLSPLTDLIFKASDPSLFTLTVRVEGVDAGSTISNVFMKTDIESVGDELATAISDAPSLSKSATEICHGSSAAIMSYLFAKEPLPLFRIIETVPEALLGIAKSMSPSLSKSDTSTE